MGRTRHTPKNRGTKYVADYDYSTDEGWSMTNAERNKIAKRAEEYERKGNTKAAEKETRKIPLAPNLAWMMRDHLGKKEFLAEGYNLKDAEIAYGKNWVDEFEVINNNEGDQDE